MYMRTASRMHAPAWPISAALRIHYIARRLLRVTPRPRAWQIMLATSRDDTICLKKRGYITGETGTICEALPRPTWDIVLRFIANVCDCIQK